MRLGTGALAHSPAGWLWLPLVRTIWVMQMLDEHTLIDFLRI